MASFSPTKEHVFKLSKSEMSVDLQLGNARHKLSENLDCGAKNRDRFHKSDILETILGSKGKKTRFAFGASARDTTHCD